MGMPVKWSQSQSPTVPWRKLQMPFHISGRQVFTALQAEQTLGGDDEHHDRNDERSNQARARVSLASR